MKIYYYTCSSKIDLAKTATGTLTEILQHITS